LNAAGFAAHASTGRVQESQNQTAYEESDSHTGRGLGQESGCSSTTEDGARDTRASEGPSQPLSFGRLHQNGNYQADAD
jgi:hypothetical protein